VAVAQTVKIPLAVEKAASRGSPAPRPARSRRSEPLSDRHSERGPGFRRRLCATASPPAGHFHYAAIPQIPRDPYDVPLALARSLLRYDSSIHLTARQQATYQHAMEMSSEKGPCCCHCWRWSAFKGMSKYLIARRHWTASAVALIIDDVQGCGGKGTPPSLPSQTTT
jgi:hypothetical protein